MQNKKNDTTKLQFFSESNIQHLENEIRATLQLVHDQRLSFHNGRVRLNRAKDDIMNICFHILAVIYDSYEDINIMEERSKLPDFKRDDLEDMAIKKVRS